MQTFKQLPFVCKTSKSSAVNCSTPAILFKSVIPNTSPGTFFTAGSPLQVIASSSPPNDIPLSVSTALALPEASLNFEDEEPLRENKKFPFGSRKENLIIRSNQGDVDGSVCLDWSVAV